jgi:hypothetical protein
MAFDQARMKAEGGYELGGGTLRKSFTDFCILDLILDKQI